MKAQISFPVHDNSLHAYYNDVLPTLSERQKEVLRAIRHLGSATCSEVATFLKTFPHTISGRFSELSKKSLIKEVGNKVINNRPHAIWEEVK
jgi:Mn-dependent DtxR family transcriptional regulator